MVTVEDGTGLEGADAFVSLAAFKAHCDKVGTDYSALTDAQLEQAIVRATWFISESHAWAGRKLKHRGHSEGEQALAWPRTGVVDGEGYAVASFTVPREIQRATIEVAIAEMAKPGVMQPVYTPSERVKSEKIGPIATEYDLSNTSAESARPVLLAVRDLIGGFLSETGGSLIAGESYRA